MFSCCCIMFPLLLICTSTVVVHGVPVSPAQKAPPPPPPLPPPPLPPPTGNVTVSSKSHVSATTQTSQVGVNSLNNTQNATGSPAVASVLGPPQNESAETLEEHQEITTVEEGDILILEDRNAVNILWPDAVVPFSIPPELAHREAEILAAFRMISDVTCIRFVKHTNEFNFLQFRDSRGCSSFVGCQGGAQSLFYGRFCSVGNLCHEIVHALGLHHEHTREDRDRYITVMWQNIKPGKQKHFRVKRGDTLNLPYDLRSIMHYGRYFFSADGSPTVLSKQGGVQMGQRSHLSELDALRLNKLYHCDERMKSQRNNYDGYFEYYDEIY